MYVRLREREKELEKDGQWNAAEKSMLKGTNKTKWQMERFKGKKKCSQQASQPANERVLLSTRS